MFFSNASENDVNWFVCASNTYASIACANAGVKSASIPASAAQSSNASIETCPAFALFLFCMLINRINLFKHVLRFLGEFVDSLFMEVKLSSDPLIKLIKDKLVEKAKM